MSVIRIPSRYLKFEIAPSRLSFFQRAYSKHRFVIVREGRGYVNQIVMEASATDNGMNNVAFFVRLWNPTREPQF